MAVVVVTDIPGVGQERYDAVGRELDLDRNPPAGLILHAAGPGEGGWRVVEVWESREAYDACVRDRVVPAVVRVAGEDAPRPAVQVTPVHNLRR